MIKLNNDRIVLLNGDCLHEMKRIKPNSIDVVIADIPYGTTACKWDTVIPFELMWSALKRIITPNGAVVLFGSQPFTSALVMSNPNWFKYSLVWDKVSPTKFLNANHRPLDRVEDIVVFSLGNASANTKHNRMTYNPQDRKEVNKIKYNKPFGRGATLAITSRNIINSNEPYMQHYTNYPTNIVTFPKDNTGLHPTQKPRALLEYLVKTYTNVGNTVLDFTMGSGTTGVACANLNRRFIGIELDENYFNIAANRIAQAVKDHDQVAA